MRRLSLSVSRHWLFALAGLMWTAVGVMLLWRAFGWLAAMERTWAFSLGFLGIVMGVTAYYFGFSNTVEKNIRRLCLLPEKVCIFAFNSWKGYLIIGVMVMLGITLRRSPLPRQYLAILYTTMGGSLFLASFHFYDRLWKMLHVEERTFGDEGKSTQHEPRRG